MPLINGLKMACEPCIRGHRSTKCTHANERLMVPVKKPGRPLSACPHLQNQLCGCSSVTAAIPRKQKCHCGTTAESGLQPSVQPRPVSSAIPDIPSPTKVSFRVQKPLLSSRPTGRKLSYDLTNLERMDPSNINITPYPTLTAHQALSQSLFNGHPVATTHGSFTNNIQNPQSFAEINSLLQSQSRDLSFSPSQSDGIHPLKYESPRNPVIDSDGSYIGHTAQKEHSVAQMEVSSTRSCCSTKQDASSENASFKSKLHETNGSIDKIASSDITPIPTEAVIESPISNGNSKVAQYSIADDSPVNHNIYSSFMPQTTIYAYPPSYGSYQQPLQPSQWRRDAFFNTYTQPSIQPEMMESFDTFVPSIFPNLDTLHTCCCGDACQCIGCAAHPYNDATRNLVHSAYIMSQETSKSAPNGFMNGQINGTQSQSNGDNHISGNNPTDKSGEETSPPQADSSPGSSMAEEQILSASDYFFVNYPFSNDGCGGDTNSCPCGDDCECIGCTIHRFDESSLALPSESWVNEHSFTNENDTELSDAVSVKDEHLIDKVADMPKKSCCG